MVAVSGWSGPSAASGDGHGPFAQGEGVGGPAQRVEGAGEAGQPEARVGMVGAERGSGDGHRLFVESKGVPVVAALRPQVMRGLREQGGEVEVGQVRREVAEQGVEVG
jgi:hypothetical protein